MYGVIPDLPAVPSPATMNKKKKEMKKRKEERKQLNTLSQRVTETQNATN